MAWELRPEMEDRIGRRTRNSKVWALASIAAVVIAVFAAVSFLM
jgi:type IV secretory pathway TrbF-like protein